MKWITATRAYIFGGSLFAVGLVVGLMSSGVVSRVAMMLCALGGSAIGVGLTARHRQRVWNKYPDQQKQYEIDQNDERNIAILGRAGYMSWFITLFVLFAVLATFLILGQTLAACLTGAAMLLHIVGFLVAATVYSRRM